MRSGYDPPPSPVEPDVPVGRAFPEPRIGAAQAGGLARGRGFGMLAVKET